MFINFIDLSLDLNWDQKLVMGLIAGVWWSFPSLLPVTDAHTGSESLGKVLRESKGCLLASLLFKSYFNDVPLILDKPKVCTFLLLRTENEHLFTYIHSSTYWVDIGCTVVGTAYLGEKAKQGACPRGGYISVKGDRKPLNKIIIDSDTFYEKN